MADFGDLLGTLMVSLVRARQLADEATSVAAEQYKRHPLLEGMSVPRVRIPELTLDVPILLKQEDPGEPAIPEEPDVVAAETAKALVAAAKAARVNVPDTLVQTFRSELSAELVRANQVAPVAVASPARPRPTGPERPLTREGVARSAESLLVRLMGGLRLDGLTPDAQRRIAAAVRARASEVAEKKPGRPPALVASFLTSEVKEQAGAANVTRLRFTLREEGLEWTTVTHDDGTTRKRLDPE